MSGRHSTEATQGGDRAGVARLRPAAPPRRDPFAHAELPQRPNYLPEEAETAGSRSEVWATLKGLAVAAAGILLLGWLLTSG